MGSKAFYINRSDFFVFDVTKVPVGSSIDGTHLFNVTETGFYCWVTSYYSLKNKTWVSNWDIERLSPLSPGNWYERHAFVKVLDDEVKGKTWVALTLFFWDGAMWIGQDEIMLFPVVIV